MYVVTGATGKLGGMIVERLLGRVDPDRVGVSVRDPAKAKALANRGVRVRRGDFDEPESLAGAFEGAARLLLVSSNAASYGGDAGAQMQAAVGAAGEAGVERIVYTSHMGADAASAFPPMRDHAAAEDVLAASGLAWTALRNGFYAETVPMMLGDAATSGVIAAPADGPVSWTAHEDLAEAAVLTLLEARPPEGPTAPLTAHAALDLTDCARILADLTGGPIERIVVDEDGLAVRMRAAGAPPGAIATTQALYRAAANHEFAAVDPALATLLGREPTTLREVLARRYGG